MFTKTEPASGSGDESDSTSLGQASYQNFLDYLYAPSPAHGRAPSPDHVAGPVAGPQNEDHPEFTNEKAIPIHGAGDGTGATPRASLVPWLLRGAAFAGAFLLALFPSAMKIYETSHWFREGDPSYYDEAKDWFSNPRLPFQPYFDNSKVLMRVYFFIIPYILSALCVAIGLSLPAVPSPLSGVPHLQRRRRVFGTLLRRTLAFPAFLRRLGAPLRVSVAEVGGVVVFLILNLMTIGVRVRRSLPRGSRKIEFLVDADDDASREPLDPVSWQACEVWAKTLGVISILNLGWYLLMPVGRKSVLLEAVNVPWERAIKYHRWVGFYSVAIMIAHSVMYVLIWNHGDGHASYDPAGVMVESNLVPWYCGQHECDQDQARMLRRNIYGVVTLLLILVMTVFAHPWIRRNRFEWFYYAHHLFLLVLVFVALHYKGSIIYLLPGIALYGVDKLLALHAYRKAAPVETKMLTCDVLEISFQTKFGMAYQAGDYVFLNVPSVSFLQWHPFSITSAPAAHGRTVTFHLKNVGPGTWTDRVIQEATKPDSTLNVRVDGFYGGHGTCDQLHAKDGVVFVGGGVGVTPMMSLCLEMCHTRAIPLKLLWVTRSIEEFAIFSTELEEAKRSFKYLRVKAWVTLSAYDDTPAPVVTTNIESTPPAPVVNTNIESTPAPVVTTPTESTPTRKVGRTFTRKELMQFDNFSSSLRSIKQVQSLVLQPEPPTFVLEQQSLSGAGSAVVMTLSLTLGLAAYAFFTQAARTYADDDTSVDLVSFLELSVVGLVVVLWVGVVFGAKRFLASAYPITPATNRVNHASPYPKAKSTTPPTSKLLTPTSTKRDGSYSDSGLDSDDAPDAGPPPDTDGASHSRTQTTDGSGSPSRADNVGVSERDLEEIVQGSIGCRLNVADELSSFARVLAQQQGRPVDVAVLASGPTKLCESINDYVNVPSAPCSLGIDPNQEVFFSFTEEVWEW